MNQILFVRWLGLIALLFSAASSSYAEVAIIVHPSNTVGPDQSAIARIFLGKAKKYSDGSKAVPVNLSEGNGTRSEFESKVLGKTNAQLKAYWSKLVFTGKGTPPKSVEAGKIKSLVAANPTFIGYIDAASVDDSVRKVHTF